MLAFCIHACSGSVIAPTLQFDVPTLEFGTVSYGKWFVRLYKLVFWYSFNIKFLAVVTLKLREMKCMKCTCIEMWKKLPV